jgi:hypothetical protein
MTSIFLENPAEYDRKGAPFVSSKNKSELLFLYRKPQSYNFGAVKAKLNYHKSISSNWQKGGLYTT